ncbi:hypothetical protein [Paraliobacillus ryukyuensis]|uniref:hypothetical protein n=1 Tax=Paraliobacillus ryukyuensis TaxID=200904 RepID=UPI0009A8E14F|nr:hypothetical protein [Paraliobacillus ryukyuensis]
MKYQQIGKRIGEMVDVKNDQYGSSFAKCGDFLEILYPNGIQPHQYKEVLALARTFDKQMRIANGDRGNESAWNDIAGYSILMSGEVEE